MIDADSTKELSEEALAILSALPADGTALGNTHLARKLKLAKSEFLLHRAQLVTRGLAKPGKGRGGGTRRSLALSPGKEPATEIVETLCGKSSRQCREALKSRRLPNDSPDIHFENRLWLLMRNLEPRLITTCRDPKIRVEKEAASPDVVSIFDGWSIIAECKHTDSEPFHLKGLETLRQAKDALKGPLRKTYGQDTVVLLLAVRDLAELTERVRNRAKELRIAILDERQIEYFLKLEKEAGLGIWHMFWGQTYPSLISPENVDVPAVQLKVGKGQRAYLFSVNAHHLLVRAFVSHRELHRDNAEENGERYVGYQRMLKKSRLKRIADYIGKYNVFPTPIVVAFEESAGDWFDYASKKDEKAEGPRIGTLHLPKKPASIQVIDGQHRLFGYTRVKPNLLHVIQVIAYKKPTPKDPAEMFVEINSEQKPVQQNLLWEIYPEIYGVGHPNFYKALITESVEQLIQAKPMAGLVTHISSGTKGPVTFHTICSEVERNDLLCKKGGLVAEVASEDAIQKKRIIQLWLESFFTALRNLSENAPEVGKNFIFTNVGLIPSLRVFSRILEFEKPRQGKKWLTTGDAIRETAHKYFGPIYDRYTGKTAGELANMRRERVGEGGFAETDEEMTNIIQFELEPGFPRRTPLNQIAVAAHRIAHEMYRINRRGISSGKTAEAVFRDFDYLIFPKAFLEAPGDTEALVSLTTVLHTSLIEGSGAKGPANRLAKLLGLGSITENPTIKILDDLRNYGSHAFTVLDSVKKQNVIIALKSLTGRADLAHPNELSFEECGNAVLELLSRILNDVLKPASDQLG